MDETTTMPWMGTQGPMDEIGRARRLACRLAELEAEAEASTAATTAIRRRLAPAPPRPAPPHPATRVRG